MFGAIPRPESDFVARFRRGFGMTTKPKKLKILFVLLIFFFILKKFDIDQL